jgi:hypothetical protein
MTWDEETNPRAIVPHNMSDIEKLYYILIVGVESDANRMLGTIFII